MDFNITAHLLGCMSNLFKPAEKLTCYFLCEWKSSQQHRQIKDQRLSLPLMPLLLPSFDFVFLQGTLPVYISRILFLLIVENTQVWWKT